MKIIFISPDLSYGGAPKMLVSTANALANYGHDVSLIALDKTIQQKCAPDIKTIQLPLLSFSKNYMLARLRTIKYIRHYIIDNGIDICIAFLDPAKNIATFATLGTRCTLILSERGNPAAHRSTKIFCNKMIRKLFPPDILVFQTEYAMSYYPASLQKRGIIINNSIPNHAFVASYDYKKNVESITKTIIHVGRLDTIDKRQDLLISALNDIQKKYPNVRLKLLGDGNDEIKLKEYAKSLGVIDKVEFAGYSSNVYKELQGCFMFVLSSDNEGFPNALLEAMSTGIPCISTDCRPGGARLLIPDNSKGQLIPRNNIKILVQAIELYLNDSIYWESCGRNGCEYVIKTFSDSVINNKWNEIVSTPKGKVAKRC